MTENPYKSSAADTSNVLPPKRVSRYVAHTVLVLGVIILFQGAIAFYFRVNILTGTRYGPSLMPVYIIFSGVGVCLVGMVGKTFADRNTRRD